MKSCTPKLPAEPNAEVPDWFELLSSGLPALPAARAPLNDRPIKAAVVKLPLSTAAAELGKETLDLLSPMLHFHTSAAYNFHLVMHPCTCPFGT